MVNVTPEQLSYVVNRATTDRALTTPEIAILKQYVTENCVDMSIDDIITKLASPYWLDNPEPQPSIPRPYWTKASFQYVILNSAAADGIPLYPRIQMLAVDSTAGPLQAAGIAFLGLWTAEENLQPGIPSAFPLNPLNANFKAAADGMLAAGIITMDLHTLLFEYLDPNWPEKVLMASPLAQMGLGAGAVIFKQQLIEVLAS